jgi:hypothetical protein
MDGFHIHKPSEVGRRVKKDGGRTGGSKRRHQHTKQINKENQGLKKTIFIR